MQDCCFSFKKKTAINAGPVNDGLLKLIQTRIQLFETEACRVIQS